MKRWLIGALAIACATAQAKSLTETVSETAEILARYGLVGQDPESVREVVEALVVRVDPRGAVLTDEQAAARVDREAGVAFEPGLRVKGTDGLPEIGEVLDESPAAAAGLKAGERIETIDGIGQFVGAKATAIERRLWADAPTPVELTVRDAEDLARTVTVNRARGQLPSIDLAEEFPADLCYLRLRGLYEDAGREVVSTLRGWAKAGQFGAILDLRGAGGSHLESIREIVGLFAEKGALLLAMRDSADQDLLVLKAGRAAPLDMPLIALVDAETAGASEALAAVLESAANGVVLIGKETSGDPAVRTLVDGPDGLKLLIPTRRMVMADGKTYTGAERVRPDILVGETVYDAYDYEPELSGKGRAVMPEEIEDRKLRDRVRGDPALRRAVDVLQGLQALNIRGYKPSNDSPR